MDIQEQSLFLYKKCYYLLKKKYGEPDKERTTTLAVAMAIYGIDFFLDRNVLMEKQIQYWNDVKMEIEKILLP